MSAPQAKFFGVCFWWVIAGTSCCTHSRAKSIIKSTQNLENRFTIHKMLTFLLEWVHNIVPFLFRLAMFSQRQCHDEQWIGSLSRSEVVWCRCRVWSDHTIFEESCRSIRTLVSNPDLIFKVVSGSFSSSIFLQDWIQFCVYQRTAYRTQHHRKSVLLEVSSILGYQLLKLWHRERHLVGEFVAVAHIDFNYVSLQEH